MGRVTGIGGLFFRARDPEALTAWYAEHLGIGGDESGPWVSAAGPTVVSAFEADTDYFGRPEQQWMPNFRVEGLDEVLDALRAAGATVDDEVQSFDYGRFGWASDPEGNRFELWEPPAG